MTGIQLPARSARGAVRLSPRSLEGQPPRAGGDELVDGVGSPRSGLIETNRKRRLQQVGRNLPKPFDAVGGREQRVVAAHRIQNKALINFEHIANVARVVHGELHTELVQTHAGTGALAIE